MDFIECYRLTECLRKGLVPDLDVYDAAAWSAPGPLSAQSLGQGSAPQKFPDFTRGKWRVRKGSAIAETERPCSQILQVTADPSQPEAPIMVNRKSTTGPALRQPGVVEGAIAAIVTLRVQIDGDVIRSHCINATEASK
jgi:hypothetical protein